MRRALRIRGAAGLGFAVLAFAAAAVADPQAFRPAGASGPVSTASQGARCIGPRALVMRTPGQIIHGDGRARTRLEIEPGFSGAGVFVAATGGPGPVWRDLSVAFAQPDVADRTKLLRYPPAFFARATPHFEMEHVGCYTATTCVDMTGNSGGAIIGDLQLSAFETGIDIDGALDTVRLLQIHAWPFGATPRQMTQIAAGVTWVRIGRVDDLKIADSMFLTGTGLAFRASVDGAATGSVTNTDFDGDHRGIVMSSGDMSVTGGYFASGQSPSDQQVVLTGGTLGIYGATMGCSSGGIATPLPAVEVAGPQAYLTIIGSPSFVCGGDDRPILAVRAGTAVFSNNTILPAPGVPYRYPKIEVFGSGSRLTAIGNRVGDKGTGGGIFIAIERDDFNRVIGNAAPGWRSTLEGRPMPLTAVGGPGVYFGN